jgi:hypothetical protein
MSKTATYALIASNTVTGSAAADVTFSSVTGTYTDLVLVISAKATTTVASMRVQFNSDTGSNYSGTEVFGNGSSAGSTRASNFSYGTMGVGNTSDFSVCIYSILDYSNTTTHKTFIGRRGTTSTNVAADVGLWRSTSAINTIKLYFGGDTIAIGSTFKLYGIQAGNA